MHEILLLRLSAVSAYFIANARAVSCKWIIAWAEPTWKSNRRNWRENWYKRKDLSKTNDTNGEDQDMEEELQNAFKTCMGETLKEQLWIFSR